MTSPAQPVADLVLEGGGVKGIALVGAVTRLGSAGYSVAWVAGSSAGATVAGLVAGRLRAGEPLERLADIFRTLDLARLRDGGPFGRLPVVGPAWSLLAHDGLYKGDYLQQFLIGALADLGVRTFGDLRISRAADPGSALPVAQSYGLVVTVSDLSRRRLARLPWDFPDYGLDPDAQSVATAIRASAAIPLFFRPVRQRSQAGRATWVDGSLLSNFPVGLFDRADSARPRWPTFGVRLHSRPGTPPVTHPVRGPLSLGLAAVDTLLTDQDAAYVDEPCTRSRTVFVDTSGVSAVDFDLGPAASNRLYTAGDAAARQFLTRWDFASYLARCRPAAPATSAPRPERLPPT